MSILNKPWKVWHLFILMFVVCALVATSVFANFTCINTTVCYENNLNITLISSVVNNQSFLTIFNNNQTIEISNNITVLNTNNNYNNISIVVNNNNTWFNTNFFNLSFSNAFTNMFTNNFNFTANFNNNVTVLQSLSNNVTVTITNNFTNVVSNTNNNNVSITIANNATFINNNYNNITFMANVTNVYNNRWNITNFNTLSCPGVTIPACPTLPSINIPTCPTTNVNLTTSCVFPQQQLQPAQPTSKSTDGNLQLIIIAAIVIGLVWLINEQNKKEKNRVVTSPPMPPNQSPYESPRDQGDDGVGNYLRDR